MRYACTIFSHTEAGGHGFVCWDYKSTSSCCLAGPQGHQVAGCMVTSAQVATKSIGPRWPVVLGSIFDILSCEYCRTQREHSFIQENTTYFKSKCINRMSIEWIEVKTLVAPWTTHSLVSGIATGVQVAKKTGSFRLHRGKNDIYRPWTNTTWNRSCLLCISSLFGQLYDISQFCWNLVKFLYLIKVKKLK